MDDAGSSEADLPLSPLSPLRSQGVAHDVAHDLAQTPTTATAHDDPGSDHGHGHGQQQTTVWTPEMEVTLFQGVAKYRPIGVHKYFRILNVQRFINKNMGTDISIAELWLQLRKYYNLENLDALADESDDDVQHDSRLRGIYPFTGTVDFELPEDFDELIEEQRKADTESVASLPDVLQKPAGTSNSSTFRTDSRVQWSTATRRRDRQKRDSARLR
ncbi:hypothetical protein BC831DRAFT_506366 [Entophlyctis helioformis]|nr:hypothetical protein BC831DRAFT_506366 [Entophlyctis helioformis]